MTADTVARLADSWFGTAILVYTGAYFVQAALLNLLALSEVRLQRRQLRLADRLGLFDGDLAPPISVLVPLPGDEPEAARRVSALLKLRYPAFEIVVMVAGREGGALRELVDEFGLHHARRTVHARLPRDLVRGVHAAHERPALLVVEVGSGARAQVLNVGLAHARHPLFLVLEPDTLLERDTLVSLALPFFEDASVLVTGGVVRPSNGCRIERGRVAQSGLPASALARFQIVETLRHLLSGRLGWNRLGSLFVLTGSLALFSRDAVRAVGGFRADTAGDESELVMRLQRWAARRRRPPQVRFVASAVAWSRVPERLPALARARARWQQGLAEALWSNRELVLDARFAPHHGVAYASQLLFELSSPVVELAGFALAVAMVAIGQPTAPFAMIFLALFVVGGTLTSLMSLGLERLACARLRGHDLEAVALYALLENFGYRQLVAACRLKGLADAALGRGRGAARIPSALGREEAGARPRRAA